MQTLTHADSFYRYAYLYIHVLMRDERRKEERTKQGQTNNKAKQHSTPKAVTLPKKNELPRVEFVYMYIHEYARFYLMYIHEVAHFLWKRDWMYMHIHESHPKQLIFLWKVTALGVLSCFALLFV